VKLQDLAKKLTLLEQRNWKPSLEISGIASDSRRVKAGDLFVAYRGPQADGHLFLEEALKRGARALVGERAPSFTLPPEVAFLKVPEAREALANLLNQWYGFPTKKLRLVGITGTNGKTTIAYLLRDLLNSRLPTGYLGTLGYRTLKKEAGLSNTTPGAEELFAILGKMAEEEVKALIMEVSSHALDQKRVHGMEFELAVFTQLTPEHLDYHETMENYFQAKRLLFTRSPRPKRMLISRDSPFGRRLLSDFPDAKSFSLQEAADYRASEINTNFEGGEFTFEGPRGKWRVKTRLPFIHNVFNATCALASLDLMGFDPQSFREPLEAFTGVPGRLERIGAGGFSVFVDYAHTPDAFENILSEARRLQPRRILTLFGCGGDRDPYKRPVMTRIAYHYSDLIILTSDNPRTEAPLEILRQMRQGLPADQPLPNVLEIPDRRQAINELLGMAEPGDALFILGKGHEDYQILGTQRIHFDDREVVREILARRKKSHVSL